MECYNPKSNQWNELSSMNSSRFKFQLATLDGLIYAAGILKLLKKVVFFLNNNFNIKVDLLKLIV
jgi:hypothetical protein